MSERYKEKWYTEKILLCYLWGLPWAAIGLLLCATIVFAPVGLLAFTVAGWPLSQLQLRHLERKRAWQDRDRPMPNEGIRPWLTSVDTGNTYEHASTSDRVEPDA